MHGPICLKPRQQRSATENCIPLTLRLKNCFSHLFCSVSIKFTNMSSYDSNSYSDDGESNSEGTPGGDNVKYPLSHHIRSTVASGSFATTGIIDQFVLPGIWVDSVGQVRLPLSKSDAKSLIQVSRQAPFGKGGETVVNTSVRNTWELDGAKIQFHNPEWQNCLHAVIGKVAHELGIAGGTDTVCAELYKMLLYEEGAMFKEHQE